MDLCRFLCKSARMWSIFVDFSRIVERFACLCLFDGQIKGILPNIVPKSRGLADKCGNLWISFANQLILPSFAAGLC